jgi:replicative DNA helicase
MIDEALENATFSIPVEQSVLGALIVNNELIDIAAAELEPEHFYESLHRRMFELIVCLATEGAVTPLVLWTTMRRDEPLQSVGGVAYIAGLADAAPAMPSIKELAKIIKDCATRRELIRIGEEMIEAAQEGDIDTPVTKIAADAAGAILDIGEEQHSSTVSLAEAIQAAISAAEVNAAGKTRSGLTTGFTKLDEAIGRIQPKDRIVLAGRSQMGKSILASNIANGVAMAAAPVLVLSADMGRLQWGARSVCDIAQRLWPDEPTINYSKFRKGTLDEGDFRRAILAQQHMQSLPIFLDDNPKIKLTAVRGRLRSLARRFKGKQGLLVVDFIQKVEPPQSKNRKDKRRDEDITDITYELGDIVGEMGWSLLALAQLKNKESEADGTVAAKPPNVTDIKESGGVEQACDICIGMFRPAFAIEHNTRKSWPDKIAELKEHHISGFRNENVMQTFGFKNRDSSATDLDLNLWCKMSCGAVRDEEPWKPLDAAEEAIATLL